MRNSYLLLLFFLTAILSVSKSQSVIVRDIGTHQGIEFVTIYTEQDKSTVTDASGFADVSMLLPADSLFFRQVGYERKAILSSDLTAESMVVKLLPATVSIGEVVVSANRWEQDEREVATKVMSIPMKQLSLQNPQTAADMLGQTGQVFIQKSQLGGGSPMIRGFAANRVLIAVDGVRMNNAIFRSGNLQNVISLDPLSLQRAEVLFGPSSVAYGSDAIGGVMSFITKKPEFSKDESWRVHGNGAVRYASANREFTLHADIAAANNKFGTFTSFSTSDFGNLRMGAHGPDEFLRPEAQIRIDGKDTVLPNPNPREQIRTRYQQFNFMQKFRVKTQDDWDFNYAIHFSTTSNVPRYDRLIQYSGGQLRSAEWYYGPQTWMMQHLNLEQEKSKLLYDKARVSMAYQYFKESRNDRRFGRDELRQRIEQVHVLSLNADFEKKLSPQHEIDYGLEALTNFVKSDAFQTNIETESEEAISTRYPDGSNWTSLAAYLSYQFRINEQLSLQAAGRYNHFWIQSSFDTSFIPLPFTETSLSTGNFNGNLGLTYNPNRSWTIRLGFSSGFRAPNIDDIGKVFDSEPGAVVVPNTDLKPENALQGEIGIEKRFGDFLMLSIDGYYTRLFNALVRDNFQINGQDSILYDGELSQVQAIQNTGEAYVWGIEAGFDLKLPAGLALSSRVNFQQGEEEDVDQVGFVPLRHVAPIFGITRLTYTRDRMRLELNVQYSGEIEFDDLAPSERNKPHIYAEDVNGNPFSPKWYTLNFKGSYQLTDNLMLSAGLENMTNRRYRTYSSGVAGAGINFVASLRAMF